MDEQLQIQRIQIIQSLESIYALLIKGAQIEKNAASLIFIAFRMLKRYWLNLSASQSVQKNNIKLTDDIDEFLKGCADLD